MLKIILSLLAILSFATSPVNEKEKVQFKKDIPELATAPDSSDIEYEIKNMTLEQRVGQMFLFGFKGKALTKELAWTLRTLKPGSLILFGRNIDSLEQLSKLTSDLQNYSNKHNKQPLFLAIDQEGGAVLRIKTTPPMPSAYTIGNTNNPTLAFRAGQVTAEMLRTLGLNMNLAPVLDVTDKNLRSFISTRSFSPSPQKISSMGLAFAEGLIEGKVLPVAKHYPGHGPIALDSHHMTPVRREGLTDLLGMDLIPFVQFSNAKIDSGTMVAHISFPLIDSSGLPATYSPVLIQNVLRKQLKYDGLIMTDDIEMAGASSYKKIGDRALAAVNAGHDLIMVGWSPKAQYLSVKSVIDAVKAGKVSEERINDSVRRILSLKARYAKTQARALASKNVKKEFLSIDYKPVFNDIISSYFQNLHKLTGAINNFQSLTVISRSKEFRLSFKSSYKKTGLSFAYSLAKKKKFFSKDLYVFHVSSWASFKELMAIPKAARDQMIVINSHHKARVPNLNKYLEVVEIHSEHPSLGKFVAEAIYQAQSAPSQAAYLGE